MVAMILQLVMAAGLLASAPALAQADRTEAEIKAAYIYQFGGFVEWPPEGFVGPDSAFHIGVVGAEPVAKALEALVAGRVIQGRVVGIRRIARGEAIPRLQVLFVGKSDITRLAEILAALKGQPVLVVTETEDGIARGAMINFVAVENRLRFDVALPPAERDGLKISARLLSVARKVVVKPS
jgi:hypothetical protein